MTPIEELANFQLQLAREEIGRGDSALSALWLVRNPPAGDPDGKKNVQVCALAVDDKMGAAIALIHGVGCDEYTFISEAWLRIVPTGYLKYYKREDTQTAPDRIETLNQVYSDKTAQGSRVYTIDRVNKSLTPFHPEEGAIFQTRLPKTW